MVAANCDEPQDAVQPLTIIQAVRSDNFAGVERYISTVSAGLAQRGHSVVAIGGDPANMSNSDAGATFEHLPAVRTIDVARQLVCHARRADVIHVHMTAAEMGAVVASPAVKAPIVATRHFAARRGSSMRARLAGSLIIRRLDAQISVSRFVASEVVEPTRVLLNGVPDEIACDPTHQIVLVAQRLEPEKRTMDALEAWEASGLAAIGWTLLIAGDGSERRSLTRAAMDRDLEGVEFLGHRDDLRSLRQAAGIFLATAPSEPFGLSVAEAMAAGLPVVATRSGGHLETVGAARPDLVYRTGDALDAARVLRTLASDLEVRREAGRDLRTFQRRELELSRHVDALVDCYHGLSGSRATRGRRVSA